MKNPARDTSNEKGAGSDAGKSAKRFWADRRALAIAGIGIALMSLTLLWRINPVEGSVVPRFLHDTVLGAAVFWLLFVTSMPAFIVALFVASLLDVGNPPLLDWFPKWLPPFNVLALLIQAVLYFLFGKLISFCMRRFRSKPVP